MASRKRTFEETFVKVSNVNFRKKFQCLFKLDPTLSEDDIYQLLALENFSVERALIEIRKGLEQPALEKFYVPAFIMSHREEVLTSPPNGQDTTSFYETLVEGLDEELERFTRPCIANTTGRSSLRPRTKSAETSSSLFDRDRVDEIDSSGDNQQEITESDDDSQATDDVENWAGKLRSNEFGLQALSLAPRLRGNPNNAVLKHRETTKLTPWTFRMAKPFYNDKIEEIECGKVSTRRNTPSMNDGAILAEILDEAQYPNRETSLRKVQLPSSSVWVDRSGKVGYSSAKVDGIDYDVGDFILILSASAATESSKRTPKHDTQKLRQPEISVAKVEYFFTDEYNEEMVHIRWFEFGPNTVLGEFACSNELFSLTQCQDVPVSHIAAKVDVDFLDARCRSKITNLGEAPQPKNKLFYKFHYEQKTRQFTDASLHNVVSENHHCHCCQVADDMEREDEVKILGKLPNQGARQYLGSVRYKTISYRRVKYHVNDFVYVFESPTTPYTVAQIISIKTIDPLRSILANSVIKPKDLKIMVDLFERYDALHPISNQETPDDQQNTSHDERRLYRTGQSSKIDVHDLDGKCYVKLKCDIPDLNAFKDKKDTFWVKEEVKSGVNFCEIQPSDLAHIRQGRLQYSSDTESEIVEKEKWLQNFLENGPKLRGMEIFCGAGGLSFGLTEGLLGTVDFVSAVEFSEAACRTYSTNHPRCKVSNGDAGILLRRAIRRQQGDILSPLLDCRGNVVHDLPQPDAIDFICGGPPCPGFSGLNRNKKADDIKNSLVILYLAYLDFFKPKYFLIENVVQILSEPLVSKHGSQTTQIEQGTLKFILRFAVSFGYQAQFALLQAAEHGTPQSRKRAFIWGSQSGYRLPPFPQPDNVMSVRGKAKVTAPKTHGWQRTRRAAPHYIVTVRDAISDLPAFEWVNPFGYTSIEMQKRQIRSDRIEQYKIEEGLKYTGLNVQPYASHPMSEFQRRSRRLVKSGQLTGHVTEPVNAKTAWKVCKVPLRPGADHRDIQDDFPGQTPSTQKANSNLQPGRYGRLDMENHFKVSHTKLDPGLVSGTLLHPTQYRIISIRENARALGFPDHFVFDLEDCETSTIKDVIRQQGNAVPPAFAKALGNEFLWARVDDYHEMKAVEQPTLKSQEVKQKTQSGRACDPILVDDDGFADIDGI